MNYKLLVQGVVATVSFISTVKSYSDYKTFAGQIAKSSAAIEEIGSKDDVIKRAITVISQSNKDSRSDINPILAGFPVYVESVLSD